MKMYTLYMYKSNKTGERKKKSLYFLTRKYSFRSEQSMNRENRKSCKRAFHIVCCLCFLFA